MANEIDDTMGDSALAGVGGGQLHRVDPQQAIKNSGPASYVAPAVIFRTELEAVAANCYGAPGKADMIECIVGNS